MTRATSACLAFVALLGAIACSSGDPQPTTPPRPPIVDIGPSGGTFELKEPEGETAVLTVPAGVFTATQTVTATWPTAPESLPDGAKSSLIAFEPRIELPPSPEGLRTKVALKVPPGTLPGSATIYWERWAQANAYDPLPTAVETKDGVVYAVAEISRLSSGFVGLHCASNAACTPTTECREGTWGCATGRPVCEERGPSPDGAACGKPASAGVCREGACVTDPVIHSFRSSQATVERGTAVVLEWSVSNADSVSIDPEVGVATGTTATVWPASTTTYTLTATNAAGTATAQVTVTVWPPVRIIKFAAAPNPIARGETSTLSWDVVNAEAISIDNGIGTVTGTGRAVSPTTTTTYRLTATNPVGTATAEVTVTVVPPVQILAFAAAPNPIAPGATSTLSWTVANADTVSIDNAIGTVTGGSRAVSPTTTTTYRLTAANAVSTATAEVTVTVVPRVQIVAFTATPPTIAPGDSTVLSWNVANADLLSIDGIGTVTGTSRAVSPTATTTYRLTAANAVSSATAEVTVTVTERPVIAAFTADPSPVVPGGASTLRWTVTGATMLSIDQGVGTVTGTSCVVNPTTTTTYTLTATNAAGSTRAQVTVTVVPAVLISSFTAQPTAVEPGGASTLRWTVTGATTLSINQGIGTVTGTSRVVNPSTTTTYTLTATNAASSATASVTVTVMAPPAISAFTANPSAVVPGGASTLRWTVTGATTLSIDQGIGTVTGTSRVVNPTTTTTYTLTATNAVRSVTRQVTVSVVPQVVISSFTAAPTTIAPGGTSTLSWNVGNADTIAIDNGIGTVTGASRTVSPTVTTTYRLTATNAASSASATVRVTVMTLPVIAAFIAGPELVPPGGVSTLAWSVSGATTISIDRGVGTVDGSSWSVRPAATTTYTLTATNAAGSTRASVTVTVTAPDSWVSRAPLGVPRRDLAAATLDGKIYAVGGVNATGLVSTLEEYDPATDTWTERTPMPTARALLAAAAVNGQLYAIGGYGNEGQYLATVEAYDPKTDSWTRRSSLPVPRGYLGAVALDGKLYVLGGWSGAAVVADVEEYDPVADTWSRRAAMPDPRWSIAAVALHGSAYAIAGVGATFGPEVVERYEPLVNGWTALSPLATPRWIHGAAVLHGLVYVIAGRTAGGDSADSDLNEEYDPATGAVTARAPVPIPRSGVAAVALDGMVYVIGGRSSETDVGTVEAYTPPGVVTAVPSTAVAEGTYSQDANGTQLQCLVDIAYHNGFGDAVTFTGGRVVFDSGSAPVDFGITLAPYQTRVGTWLIWNGLLEGYSLFWVFDYSLPGDEPRTVRTIPVTCMPPREL